MREAVCPIWAARPALRTVGSLSEVRVVPSASGSLRVSRRSWIAGAKADLTMIRQTLSFLTRVSRVGSCVSSACAHWRLLGPGSNPSKSFSGRRLAHFQSSLTVSTIDDPANNPLSPTTVHAGHDGTRPLTVGPPASAHRRERA
jgi:hypothetical protein